jgi:GTP-binding protein
VERTRVLVHVVDASGTDGRDPVADLRLAREEVRRWDHSMLTRPQIVAATKRDLAGENDPLPALRTEAASLGHEVVAVSAWSGEGLTVLKRRLLRALLSSPVSLAQGHP